MNIIFYKISCNDTNIKFVYVGQTNDFYHRKTQHKARCNNIWEKQYNNYQYKYIRLFGGFDNWNMSIIDTINCIDDNDLLNTEIKYIRSFEYILNTQHITKEQKEKQLIINDTVITDVEIQKGKDYANEILTCCCGLTYIRSKSHNHKESNKHKIRIECIEWLLQPDILIQYTSGKININNNL